MRQEEEEREIDENKIIILNQQLQRNRSVSKIPDYYKDMKDRGRERERVRKREGGGADTYTPRPYPFTETILAYIFLLKCLYAQAHMLNLLAPGMCTIH